MCEILQIKKTRTTAYHPAKNGQVENFNRVVKSLLKSKIDNEPQQWDKHLGASLMAYRSSVHKSTGYTPFSLMLGREMRLPLDVMICETPPTSHSYRKFASNLKGQLTSAYQDAYEQLGTAHRTQKEYFDRGLKEAAYEPEELILLVNPQLKVPSKLEVAISSEGTCDRDDLPPDPQVRRPSAKSFISIT